MYNFWAIQKCHRHTDSHIQKGMSWDTEPDLQAPPLRPHVTEQPPWPGWEKEHALLALGQPNDSNCSQTSGNGPDQWKSISSCNPNTWNFRNILWNTLWKYNPATRDANLNVHLQTHTVQFLWHIMDLHTPSLVSFGTKNLLIQSKRTVLIS